eukprot:COSAG02_NODE_13322_length_1409_cov_1.684973_1_plen_157_part_01
MRDAMHQHALILVPTGCCCGDMRPIVRLVHVCVSLGCRGVPDAASEPVIIATPQGRVAGLRDPVTGVEAFKGIPVRLGSVFSPFAVSGPAASVPRYSRVQPMLAWRATFSMRSRRSGSGGLLRQRSRHRGRRLAILLARFSWLITTGTSACKASARD